MPIKNNLKYWRHQCQMDKKEFASFLGVNYYSYIRWEKQTLQPGYDNLFTIRDALRTKFPDIKVDDIICPE